MLYGGWKNGDSLTVEGTAKDVEAAYVDACIAEQRRVGENVGCGAAANRLLLVIADDDKLVAASDSVPNQALKSSASDRLSKAGKITSMYEDVSIFGHL